MYVRWMPPVILQRMYSPYPGPPTFSNWPSRLINWFLNLTLAGMLVIVNIDKKRPPVPAWEFKILSNFCLPNSNDAAVWFGESGYNHSVVKAKWRSRYSHWIIKRSWNGLLSKEEAVSPHNRNEAFPLQPIYRGPYNTLATLVRERKFLRTLIICFYEPILVEQDQPIEVWSMCNFVPEQKNSSVHGYSPRPQVNSTAVKPSYGSCEVTSYPSSCMLATRSCSSGARYGSIS